MAENDTNADEVVQIECPMCGEEVPKDDLKEYDPGEPVCSDCRDRLSRMDYYSGAGDW